MMLMNELLLNEINHGNLSCEDARCKIYNKNVGLRQNKNVGKPTFLFCILGHIDTLLLEVFQYENQFTRRVNHHGQFRG